MNIRGASMALLSVATLGLVGCSTTAHFTIPQGTTLTVYQRPVELDEDGSWKTRPFFWSAAGGAPYLLMKDGQVVDEGKLATRFRVVSIFWPPAALIYWPMGFRSEHYDLTNPDATNGVRSTRVPKSTPAPVRKKGK